MDPETRRLMDAARHGLRLDVPCPTCRAGYSEPCRSSTGKYRPRVHKPRETASAAGMTQGTLF